jgi:hypothetical protein
MDLCARSRSIPRKTLGRILLTVFRESFRKTRKTQTDMRNRSKGRERRCIQSVDQSRLGLLNARRTLTPLALRVCTPRYYDTQQLRVYSTPSKNTLRAERRARSVVLGDAPENGCAVGALSKNHALPVTLRHWPRDCTRLRLHRATNPLGTTDVTISVRPDRDPANDRAAVARAVTPSTPRAGPNLQRGLKPSVPHAAMRNFSAAIGRRMPLAIPSGRRCRFGDYKVVNVADHARRKRRKSE